jgi:hypothetical protein
MIRTNKLRPIAKNKFSYVHLITIFLCRFAQIDSILIWLMAHGAGLNYRIKLDLLLFRKNNKLDLLLFFNS